MGRLIDADEVIKTLEECHLDKLLFEKDVFERIDSIPTAYDVDKVTDKLKQQAEQYRRRGFEHEQKGYSNHADKYYGKQCSYLHAIDIVKAGGME